jgi:excisionase family DNA binding protein
MTDTEWMTPAQAARVLGVSAERVRQLADAGYLAHQRTILGRIIDAESVERLRAEREAARLRPAAAQAGT